MKSKIAQIAYRTIERINGEKGLKLIPYSVGHKIKWQLMDFI